MSSLGSKETQMRKTHFGEMIPGMVSGKKLSLKPTPVLLIVVLLGVGFSLASSCVEVKGGERAVIYSKISGVLPGPWTRVSTCCCP
jgi:hypothetical protein